MGSSLPFPAHALPGAAALAAPLPVCGRDVPAPFQHKPSSSTSNKPRWALVSLLQQTRPFLPFLVPLLCLCISCPSQGGGERPWADSPETLRVSAAPVLLFLGSTTKLPPPEAPPGLRVIDCPFPLAMLSKSRPRHPRPRWG